MTASNREAAISKTLTYEGGYTNDPRDPGGATNWGITITDARRYWKYDASPADVKAMPKSVAVEIYRKKYWAVLDCDNRPSGPDFVDFDLGVNSGIKRVSAFRRVLDPLKLAPVDYVKRACAMRLSFLRSLKTFVYFGKGWSRRVASVEAFGVRLALGAQGKPLAPALHKEADAARKHATVHATKAVIAAGTGLAAAGHVHIETVAGVACLCIGAVALAAYFIWNATHHANRVSAYTAQLAGQPEALKQ